MQLCWHGCGCFSLRLGGTEVLVDPYLSPPGTYASWHVANPHAPPLDDFFRLCAPDIVLISHGHFDHFDLEAARAVKGRTAAVFCGSAEVTAALADQVGVPRERLRALEAGRPARLGGLAVEAVAGVHWQTGEEGTMIANKLAGRPDRYGAFPCGGPALGFLLWRADAVETGLGAALETGVDCGPADVYISGDTLLEGVPRRAARVAVMTISGPLRHPKTGEVCMTTVGEIDCDEALRRLGARAFVPVHWDFPLFLEAVDIAAVARRARDELGVAVLLPPCNQWVEVPGAR